MSYQKPYYLLIVILSLFLVGCGGSENSADQPEQRSFYMGFTPWPYAATIEAVNDVYSKIQDHGDLLAHHLTQGIPWEAAYRKQSYPQHLEDELALRLSLTQTNKRIYLALDSLNMARDNLSLNWGESGTENLTSPWNGMSFSDEEVITAYANFALDLIDRFNPDYFNYATEISELILNDPSAFDDFVSFAQAIYQRIKLVHPELPLMISIGLKEPGSLEARAIEISIGKIMDFVDIVGISVYPYAFFDHDDKGNPAKLSANWLNQITNIAKGKPLAVTETGWIAEDLEITAFNFSEQSSEEEQRHYLNLLMQEANKLSMAFVVWFSVVDFDSLWNDQLGKDNLAKIWKDTGLYSETLQPRIALDVWDDYYHKDKSER